MVILGQELERHRAAVADVGPSPVFDSVDESGAAALVLHDSGSGPGLPFRVTWLAMHAQGRLPDDEERRNPVWDAFCDLPPAAQTALWHREVEGQEATEISRLLDTTTDEVRRNLATAYAAVRARVEQVPAPSRGVASQLLLLQHSLRDTLAGVVLGPVAGRYLALRPRVGRRVPIEATPRSRRRSAPYLVGLTVAVVGVAAAVTLLGPGPVPTTTQLPAAEAAPFEVPVVGSYLEAVTEPAVRRAPRAQAPRVVPTVATSSTRGGGSAGTNAGPSGAAPNGGPDQQNNTNQPGGDHDPQPGPASPPTDDGPGQGLQHASDQGVSNGVRAHGAKGNKGGNGKAKGQAKGKAKGQAKAKGRVQR